jgi:hypothetical protein
MLQEADNRIHSDSMHCYKRQAKTSIQQEIINYLFWFGEFYVFKYFFFVALDMKCTLECTGTNQQDISDGWTMNLLHGQSGVTVTLTNLTACNLCVLTTYFRNKEQDNMSRNVPL